jgi:uncharacterized OsmC-like protein
MKWISDAPIDNHGKGSSFSPTDSLAGALGACYMTIMGIAANAHEINIIGAQMNIQKSMSSNPRKIEKVTLRLHMPDKSYSPKQKAILAKSAESCPVSRSLHPDMIIDFQILWA